MSNETIEELSVNYEDETGTQLVREVDKAVLSRSAWATILFRYQEWQPKTGDYSPDKYTLRRYKKVNGMYRMQTKFNISNAKQAREIIDVLTRWTAEAGDEA